MSRSMVGDNEVSASEFSTIQLYSPWLLIVRNMKEDRNGGRR